MRSMEFYGPALPPWFDQWHDRLQLVHRERTPEEVTNVILGEVGADDNLEAVAALEKAVLRIGLSHCTRERMARAKEVVSGWWSVQRAQRVDAGLIENGER